MSATLTTAEVAQRLGIGDRAVRDGCRTGRIPCELLGKGYRIPAAVVQRFEQTGHWLPPAEVDLPDDPDQALTTIARRLTRPAASTADLQLASRITGAVAKWQHAQESPPVRDYTMARRNGGLS
ncbi:MAG: hypothetical protein CL878_03600 [Dehalococcoidia bacterium]|nr:hypothetical protein [Dehalococcoidia bacterium]